MNNSSLHQAIERLPIPVLWERLGLPGRVSSHCVVRSPLRDDDRHPSFSIFADGRRFKDHANGETGDSFDFYQRITKTDAKTAWRPFKSLAGIR